MRPDSPLVTRCLPSPNFGDRRGRAIDMLILHYTGMASGAAALARLTDPGAEVSCHYLVWEDGRIDQLVAEADRAWHAGRSAWAGERDLNSVSIGIEIVNGGHDFGLPPYPEPQIRALVALCADVCRRHAISPRRVLGHSDIAPDRKEDPGEHFPWHRLAGIALHVPAGPIVEGPILRPGDRGPAVRALQAELAAIGYVITVDGAFGPQTEAVVRAVQRRFRPERVDGRADPSTRATLAALTCRPD